MLRVLECERALWIAAGSAVVSGIQLGNVWIGVQPALGVEGDPMRLLFDRQRSSSSPAVFSPLVPLLLLLQGTHVPPV